jgi:SOUL heme-binding protein
MSKSLTLATAIMLAASPLMAENSMPKMMYKSTETPAYEVISSAGKVELRQYAPRITAEVAVTGPRLIAINKGFSVLAGYIFGGNQAQAKVAMTSPVAQSGEDGDWTVQFTMPSGYTLETLPKPNDARITFAQHPAQRQMAIEFSGLATQGALDTAETDLRAAATSMRLTLGAGPFYYFYDAPMTLPWNRRNEVAFFVN